MNEWMNEWMNKWMNEWEWPDAPVFQLEVFVSLDAAVALQKVLQAMSRKAKGTWSLMSVKHADDVDTKVTL